MQRYPLILASSSPRRRELLATLGLTYTIIKPNIDETPLPDEPPLAYVQRLSQEKATTVAQQANDAAIVAADTIVVLAADTIGITESGELLGKPADADEARIMLRKLRARPHMVITAFSVWMNAQLYTHAVQTQVWMRHYSDDEIEAYIATGDPFDKAGSYAIQHEGFHPVARIEGSHTNVVGLPMEAVEQTLRQVGVLT